MRQEVGMTLMELMVAMGIGSLLLSVLASTILVVLWLPGERSDRIAVAQDVQNAEHWITRDANSANSFVAGSSPTYGTFSWSDYTGASQKDFVVAYSYDAANGYLMRTEQQNGMTASTLAVGKNLASEGDAVFVWSPGAYSIQVSLTSTVATGTTREDITSTVRSGLGTMAARPRSEPLLSPPGDVSIPPSPPGSVTYSIQGQPVMITGTNTSGAAAQLQSIDSDYYCVGSTSGSNKQASITMTSQNLTLPSTISQIEVRFTGNSDKRNVTLSFFVQDSAAGFPSLAESGFTFTEAGVDRTDYFYLSPAALAYVNSLGSRRVDLMIDSFSGNANFNLCIDQILFIASP